LGEWGGEVRGKWRGARDVARCEGRGEVRGMWRCARDVARYEGRGEGERQ